MATLKEIMTIFKTKLNRWHPILAPSVCANGMLILCLYFTVPICDKTQESTPNVMGLQRASHVAVGKTDERCQP